jgi:hypothetical protein
LPSIVRSLVVALNSGDADAYAALFAPNATLERPPAPPFAVGTAQIRQWAAGEIAQRYDIRISGTPTVSGTAVTWAQLQTSPALQANRDNECLEIHGAAIVEGGRIQRIIFTDFTTEPLAMCRALPPVVAGVTLRLPAAGGGPAEAALPVAPLGLGSALAAASVGLVCITAVLSRRRLARALP